MRQLCCSLGVVDGTSLWPEVEAPGHWRRVDLRSRASLREAVRRGVEQGMKRAEIAAMIGNTESWVDKLIDEMGLRKRKNRPRGAGALIAAQARQVKLAEPQLQHREVAARVGVSSSHLNHLLRAYPAPTSEITHEPEPEHLREREPEPA